MKARAALRAIPPVAWAAFALLVAGLLCLTKRVAAEDVVVPISLQMELMLKVATYDKNLQQRAGDAVRIAVLIKVADADSVRSGAQALKTLSVVGDVAGMPLERTSVSYSDGPALARVIRDSRISIVYVTPGFDEENLDVIARALDGVSVLSAGAHGKYASRGVVLGFDLIGGKPKLLVNLELAKRQHVELSSSVLKLMRVVE
jgi:hypothetical protein